MARAFVKYELLFQYAVVLMAFFAVLAWFGSLIDNLLLTYIIGECMLK